jgi:uncharacterized membrane protein YcaP (DUF421 family)
MLLASIPYALFHLGEPVWVKILRTIAVYAAVAALLRIGGKRDLAQLNTLDLVVLLLLSNVVQNAIIGDDLSLPGAFIGAAVLLAGNALIVRLIRANVRVARVLEGTPTVVVRDGELDEAAIRRLGLRDSDVVGALRRQGASMVDEVEKAAVEPGGTISVELRPADMNATKGDIDRLEAKLDALAARVGPGS